MNSDFNSFLLKGIFSSYCIRDLETAGILRAPAQTNEERRDHDLFVTASETIRQGSVSMQRYYRMLYVFENLIREFIDNTFSEGIENTNWFSDRASKTMKQKYESRRSDEVNNSWHIGRNEHPLYYMDFSDLSALIINHWDVFKDFFPDQAWVSSRINDCERTRNVIAHTNELPAEEGVRLQMHLQDWIRQIG